MWLGQEMAALDNVLRVAIFACHLMNFTSKFGLQFNNLIEGIIELKYF
jgi:hypothetical protein